MQLKSADSVRPGEMVPKRIELLHLGLDRYGNRVPSEQERRVIERLARGLKNHEVAEAIGTTEHVVKNYVRVIYDKLGLWNRVEIALWYEAHTHHADMKNWKIGGGGEGACPRFL